MFNETYKESPANSAAEIYSQAQLPRYRRGVSLLRSNSKTKHNDSLNKFKKEIKETSLNFYEGLKSKQGKTRPKQDTTPAVAAAFTSEDDINIEELHY